MEKIKVGDRFESNNFGWFEVIEYNSYTDVVVKFEQTGCIVKKQAGDIRRGQVKDYLLPLIYGVGYTGKGTYRTSLRGKLTAEYSRWFGILDRCYSERFQEKNPAYKGCSVCKEWHNFQVFAEYYEDNHKEGYHLDKDLLFKGNRVYSPETCVFVPPCLNGFILSCGSARGEYKVGVYLNMGSKTNPYKSQISNTVNGKQIHLGLFPTEQLAHQAWLTAKLSQALEYKTEMDAIDERIYPNVVEIIKEM